MLDTLDPINAIPDPETIRARLSEAVREVDLLRRLLRLAVRAAKERPERVSRREVAHVR